MVATLPPPRHDAPVPAGPADVAPAEPPGPPDVAPAEVPEPEGTAGARGPAEPADQLGLLGVFAAFLLPVACSPQVIDTFWAPKAAACLLLVGPGLVALAHLVRIGSRPATLAMLFLGAATASTLASGNVAASVTGAANWGTGLLFVASVTGAWALGVVATDDRRRQMAAAFVAAVAVNAVLAWLQANAMAPDFLSGSGRAFGLTGNPVQLGALSAAGIWVLARWVGRERRSLRLLGLVVLVAGAAQLSGGRSAVGLSVLAVLAALAGAGRRRGAALLAAVALGFLAAPVWAGAGAVTGSGRAVGAESTSQIDTRLGFWKIGAAAMADRPVLGWGPGRFRAATGPRYTAAVSEGGVTVYMDAHNWIVEYGVSTGLLGLGLLLAWLTVAGRAARGPLAGVAVTVGLFTLVEPQFVGITPVALLLLGASTPTPGPRLPGRGWRAAAAVGLAGGLVAGGILLAGEAYLRRGSLDSSAADVRRGAALLPAWADVSRLGARTEVFAGLHSDEHREAALELARQATRRDPTDSTAWSFLGQLEMVWGTDQRATVAIDRALARNPWSAGALVQSATVGRRTGDEARVFAACDRLHVLGKAADLCGGAS